MSNGEDGGKRGGKKQLANEEPIAFLLSIYEVPPVHL